MKKWIKRSIALLYLSSFFFAFASVNGMVSQKYETDSPNDCISTVNGINICKAIKQEKIIALAAFILATGLLIYNFVSVNEEMKVTPGKKK